MNYRWSLDEQLNHPDDVKRRKNKELQESLKETLSLGWLYRDPLRGASIDQWPYQRVEGEIRLDFIFKGCLYGGSLLTSLVFSPVSPVFWVLIGSWVSVNFIRRNG